MKVGDSPVFHSEVASGFRHDLAGIPNEFAQLIKKCCHFRPKLRPTCPEILAEIQRLAVGLVANWDTAKTFSGDSGWSHEEILAAMTEDLKDSLQAIRKAKTTRHPTFLSRINQDASTDVLEATEVLVPVVVAPDKPEEDDDLKMKKVCIGASMDSDLIAYLHDSD